MIKHIVLFQLKPFDSEKEKMAKMQKIKSGLEGLMGVVKELKSMKVGLNCNPAETYDIALVTTFDTMDGLHAYAIHPQHLAVAKVIAEARQGRACVDFVV